MDYLKAFTIGSSAFTFVPFYVAVTQIPEKKFDIHDYPVKASLYFGTMNMISLAIGELFGLTLWQRLFIINIISIIFIISWITYYQSYDFKSRERWLLQYVLIALGHTMTYFLMIGGLTYLL